MLEHIGLVWCSIEEVRSSSPGFGLRLCTNATRCSGMSAKEQEPSKQDRPLILSPLDEWDALDIVDELAPHNFRVSHEH